MYIPQKSRAETVMRLLFFIFFSFFFAFASIAAEIGSISGEAGPSRRDLTRSQFDNYASQYRTRGFRMTDVDVYVDGGRRYAQQWRRNDGRRWAVERDLTSSQYSDRFATHVAAGLRPIDVEGYRNSGRTRFAGIWIENREGVRWSLYRNMTNQQFRERNLLEHNRNRQIVDFEAYPTSQGVRYAGIWDDSGSNANTFFRRNLSRSRYQSWVNEKQDEGFKVFDYEKYENDDGDSRYAAIWKRAIKERVIVKTNLSATAYRNLFRKYSDEGYRPVDFERLGSSYGAVWRKAYPDRANYAGKAQLDALFDTYRTVHPTNSPPGVSAAVVVNGTVVWQRGDGMADRAERKAAHAGTIYKLASISKPIGATLFGRLEDRGRLQNGTTISLAASDPVRNHLTELPTFHNYTLLDLLKHRSCVGSYGRETAVPDNENYSNHFDTMRDAVGRYANTPLANRIYSDDNGDGEARTDGSDGPGRACQGSTYYSNHGFGMLGSAIEAATGRPIKSLIDSELSTPFNLPTLRAMFQQRRLESNSERSRPYRGNVEQSYSNTSWKVIVGGIESSAIDLARFGWLAGDARLTSASFRDNNLFAPSPDLSDPNSVTRGYGWVMRSIDGRRVATHGGSSTGAATMLFVWPDDDLSIALLSNQSPNDSGFMRSFVRSMSQIVFNQM
jgi:CubicO group peptidase (beta-lactamase class C family)